MMLLYLFILYTDAIRAGVMMDFLDSLKRCFLYGSTLLLFFLFFTRPEHSISPQDFIDKMKTYSYQTYYSKKITNADVSYVAKGMSNVQVFYAHFNNEQDCKNYYTGLTLGSKGKPMRSVSRDQRIQKVASEKLTYEYEDYFYAFLYTKNAVIHAKTYIGNKTELVEIFRGLNEKKVYSMNELIEYYQDYFKKAETNVIK